MVACFSSIAFFYHFVMNGFCWIIFARSDCWCDLARGFGVLFLLFFATVSKWYGQCLNVVVKVSHVNMDSSSQGISGYHSGKPFIEGSGESVEWHRPFYEQLPAVRNVILHRPYSRGMSRTEHMLLELVCFDPLHLSLLLLMLCSPGTPYIMPASALDGNPSAALCVSAGACQWRLFWLEEHCSLIG